MKRSYRGFPILIWAFFLASLLPDCSWCEDPPSRHWAQIEEIQREYLLYGQYSRSSLIHVDISDLIVDEHYLGRGDPFSTLYDPVPDFKLLLLQRGFAELRHPETATQQYKDAQTQAQADRQGIWLARLGPKPGAPTPSPSPTPEQPPDSSSFSLTSLLQTVGAYLWQIISVLATLGFVTLFWRRLEQRKPRLLILGEKSAGKSCVCTRLLKSSISSNEIRNMNPTRIRALLKTIDRIPAGNLQIYPKYIDVPGTEYGVIFDELATFQHLLFWFRPRVILFVLASNDYKDATKATAVNQTFIDEQFGVIKAQLEAILKSKTVRKPKAVILFVNKFDLFSDYPPDDPAASAAKSTVESLFFRHIQNITMAAGRSRVITIIGSALRNWGFAEIKEAVAGSYGK